MQILKSHWLYIAVALVAGGVIGYSLHSPPRPIADSLTVRESKEVNRTHTSEAKDVLRFSVTPTIFQPTYEPAETSNVRGTVKPDTVLRPCPVFDVRTSLVLPDSSGVLLLTIDSIAAESQTIGHISIASWFKPQTRLDTSSSYSHSEKQTDSSTSKEHRDSVRVITLEPDSPLLTSGFSLDASLLRSTVLGLQAIRPGLFGNINLGTQHDGIRPFSLVVTAGVQPSTFSLAHPLNAITIDANARVVLWQR